MLNLDIFQWYFLRDGVKFGYNSPNIVKVSQKLSFVKCCVDFCDESNKKFTFTNLGTILFPHLDYSESSPDRSKSETGCALIQISFLA